MYCIVGSKSALVCGSMFDWEPVQFFYLQGSMVIVSFQIMCEGVDGGVFLYSRCKNRASVFPGLNVGELLDSHLCIVSIAEDIMFGDTLGLSVHDR